MTTTDKEAIRQNVRNHYSQIANQALDVNQSITGACCQGQTPLGDNSSQCGCGGMPVSPEALSEIIGYSKADLENVPQGANMGLGCGNPVAMASILPGQTVVDLGSGGGFDCFLAGRKVGENGKVIGVDMTPDMVAKARNNAKKADVDNVEFRLGEIENLPVADNTADLIISNCVINLSPEKQKVYQEAFRILKPGGRLSISDIVATAPIPEQVMHNLELISACIGGAQHIDDIKAVLAEIGFEQIAVTARDESRPVIDQYVPGRNAGDYVVSAYIEAVKPA